jgi:short chain dehydrogenase
MVQLNVAALTTLTRLALPGMRQRGWGRILNVASLVGYQPGAPQMATYYATKAYVLSFSKGLALELNGSGVSVTALCPGPTETSFDDSAGADVDVLFKYLPKMTAAAPRGCGRVSTAPNRVGSQSPSLEASFEASLTARIGGGRQAAANPRTPRRLHWPRSACSACSRTQGGPTRSGTSQRLCPSFFCLWMCRLLRLRSRWRSRRSHAESPSPVRR